jgi:hypothetical protein
MGARLGKNLYHLDLKITVPTSTALFSLSVPTSMSTWHQRLGHVNHQYIHKMANSNMIDGLNINNAAESFLPCEGCAYGKSHRTPFPTDGRKRATSVGELIHSDICGPMSVPSIGGSRYYVLFKDDFSGFRVVHFIRQKSEASELFKLFVIRLHSETGQRVHTLRSDNGGEYGGKEFNSWLSKKGIKHESSAPYNPEQNGVSERANRTVVESARSLIHMKKLPLELWAEAINCAVYTLNRVMSRTISTTPYEAWFKTKPNVGHFKVFGSEAYVHIPECNRKKLDPKSEKCFFVGYSETHKAYRFWNADQRKIKISRDAIFNEESTADTPIYSPDKMKWTTKEQGLPPAAITDPTTQDDESDPFHGFETEDPHIDPKASNEKVYPQRVRKPPGEWWKVSQPDCAQYALHAAVHPDIEEPSSYNQAIQSNEAKHWMMAMKEEFDSLIKNGTWALTNLPPGKTVIKSRWVYKLKRGSENEIQRFKARFVAKGFSQKPGIDFDETYAPVVKYDSLRTILAIAAAEDLEISQLDVKTAFLNGDLEEEIYLQQPQGFAADGKEKQVCRLLKSLYGLKQASRSWNQKFDSFLTEYGLTPSTADQCVYFNHDGKGLTIVAIWVDDGLICSYNQSKIDSIVQSLNSNFEITSGPAAMFVGLQISRIRSQKLLFLHQSHYIRKVLKRFNMADCNPKKVPADPHSRLDKNMCPSSPTEMDSMSKIPYREAVGSLLYIMVTTRPEIAFAVNQVSRFCQNPGPLHWESVKRILSYLAGTINYGLRFCDGPNSGTLVAFSDSDYAGDQETRRSTSGNVFMFNNGPVAWGSKQQHCVTLSTAEAEYVAACEAAKVTIWLRRLLHDITFTQRAPTPLLCDNQSTIKLVYNPELHQRTKHIEIRLHFIREKQAEGEINVSYVDTSHQLADIFTKPLDCAKFETCRKAIGVEDLPIVD